VIEQNYLHDGPRFKARDIIYYYVIYRGFIMKMLFGFFVLGNIFLSQAAYSMPCDSGYLCVSKTGKYKVELQRCRYRNSIHLISTKINNVEIPEATLNQGWDGETTLAFEINLPVAEPGQVKILTAEMAPHHRFGLMKIKYAESEPGPLTVLHTERMSCKIEE
jgi:hypothetical protein